jgi:hypothetical protein
MDRKSNLALFLVCLIFPTILLFPTFSSVCLAKKVTLGWDANPEPDLEGYVIYRNVGSPGPPYKFSSTLPEDDLVDPLHPKVTLTGLSEGKEYYIALTAYNTDGVESRFSNDVCVEIVDSIVETCTSSLSDISGSNQIGGSGSGAACFIKSAGGVRQHLHETSN